MDNSRLEEKDADVGTELRVLIENNQVGGIIGKGGTNVNRVREECGVFLSIMKAESPNVTERIMVLKGTNNQLSRAAQFIAELMIEADAKLKKGVADLEQGVAVIRLLVHRSSVGAVIGKGGAVIKETQSETGCRVQVANEVLPQSTEKTVTLTGTPTTVYQAFTRVIAQLRDYSFTTKTPMMNYPYVPSNVNTNNSIPSYNQSSSHMYNQKQQAPSQSYVPPEQLSTQKIAIPTVCAGAVIGKGGAVIRDLRSKSGTNISIADADPTNPGERVVTLTGVPQGIRSAISHISHLVEHYIPPQQSGY